MKKIFILFILLTNICAFGQTSTLIEPNGNNGILSKNVTTLIESLDPEVIALPISGGGTRLMWIPAKSAFRVGTVFSSQWDDINIGTWSFASGYSSIASGKVSVALGNGSTASGFNSMTMGTGTTASGKYSTAMGRYTNATSYNSITLGAYNLVSGTTDSWINTEPLFIIGNGSDNSNRNNALTLLKNSNLGLNTATPQYQLSFKDDLGDKISLYGGNTTNTSPHYGMGIQSAKFQIFTPTNVDDVVIGYGRSAAFTENIRFKGNGNVGIGTSTPNAPLQFASVGANRKIVMWETANNDHQYVGFGVNGNALRYQVDLPVASHIFYAASSASSSNELMRIQGNGLVGIGVNSPSEYLDVNGRMRVRHRPGNTAGVWMSNDVNSTAATDGAFYGLKSNTEAGIFIGSAWQFSVNNVGDLTAGGEINRSQTNTANMVPIAYGNVNVNGTLYTSSSTDNISVTKTGTGVYQITISGETYSSVSYTTTVSLSGGNLFGFIGTVSSSGNLMVYTANSSGVATDYTFTFVVYKK